MGNTPARYTLDMGVTQSMLLNFLACRYRSKLALEGWEAKQRKASFRFGTLVHDALEHFYNGIYRGAYTKTNPAATLDDLSGVVADRVRENIRVSADRVEELEAEGVIAEALLDRYMHVWAADYDREWVGVEGEFDHRFQPDGKSGPSYRLRGKRDAVFVDRPKKGAPGLWLLETKTKAVIDEDTLDLALSFDFQSLFYLLTLDAENTTGYPIRGCLYNVIRKPSLRPYKATKKRKKAETDKEFFARVKKDIVDKPDHYFKRFEVVFPLEGRKEFRQQLAMQLEDFAKAQRGELPIYRNPNSCMTKYKCEFLEHCSAGSFAGYAKTRQFFPELSGKPVPLSQPVRKTPTRATAPGKERAHGR